MPAPTVGAGAGVAPAAITAVTTMPAPSLAVGVTVTAPVVLAFATIPAPTVVVAGRRLPAMGGQAVVRVYGGAAELV